MSDIAESAGLSHTADVMFIIIQDAMMHIENEYFIKLVKIRNGKGKNWKCKYKVDYSHMRLIETTEVFEPKI